jgi:uncharacterized protein YndB with AHSA1/START domain
MTRISLDSDTDVVIRRRFSHSPAMVWRALTEPLLIRKWLSPDLIDCQNSASPARSSKPTP